MKRKQKNDEWTPGIEGIIEEVEKLKNKLDVLDKLRFVSLIFIAISFLSTCMLVLKQVFS